MTEYIYIIIIVAVIILGVYFSIKRTKTEAKKKIVVKGLISVGISAVVLIFVPFVLYLLDWISREVYRLAFWLFFVFLIPINIWVNHRIKKL